MPLTRNNWGIPEHRQPDDDYLGDEYYEAASWKSRLSGLAWDGFNSTTGLLGRVSARPVIQALMNIFPR